MAKKAITIRPGETVVLPSGATIDALVLDGAIDVSSTCNNLPVPSSYKCGYFWITLDNDDNGTHSMDEESTAYKSITVGGTEYVIGTRVIATGDNAGTMTLAPALNTYIPNQAIFKFLSNTRHEVDHRQDIWIHFRVPEYLWDTVVLTIDNRGSIQYYLPYTAQDCADIPSE